MTKTQIVKKLKEAKQGYYNGNSDMTDAEFDNLEDELRAIDPDNSYFKLVGTTGNTKTKFKHEIPMLSCGKAKTVADVMTWLGKVATPKTELIVQPKIDGLSATAIYKDGKLVTVATRGDGKIGQDITHIAQFVNIPKTILTPGRVEVRGELYIPKNSTVPNPDGSPLRNIAVGFVNRKGGKHSLDDLSYVHFVAFHLELDGFGRVEEKMGWLDKNKFEFVEYKALAGKKKISDFYTDYLDHVRDVWNYETDGLVLTINSIGEHIRIDGLYEVSHHHHYNIALKPPSEGKKTYIRQIEWNVSRQGKLIPVAIVDPVTMGGATIRRCTLNNYENVTNLKLNIDDEVIIERANDVIPFFKQNLTPHKKHGKEFIPAHCKCCGTKVKVDGIHLVCNNAECKEQNILKIVHWVKNCEMEQFSEASVRALFEAGKLKTMKDLYNLMPSDFSDVEGFGSKKIKNAIEQIEATKEMTIGEFVDRLGIDLVGIKAMKKLGINTPAGLLAHKDRTYVIGQNLMDYVKENRKFVEELLDCVVIKKEKEIKMNANSRKVCFTGKGPKKRDDLIDDITNKGDVYVDRVTKETEILICEDTSGGSTKLAKARKLGVELVSYNDYFGT